MATTISKGPLKILYMIYGFGVGGAEYHLLSLCKGLDRNRFRPEIIYFQREEALLDKFRAARIPCTLFPVPHDEFSPTEILRLARLIRQRSPALVHVHLYHASRYGALASFLSGHRLIVRTKHSLRNSTKEIGRRDRIWRVILPRITTCQVAVSQAIARQIRTPHVIYHGVDTNFFDPGGVSEPLDERLKAGFSTLGVLGRLVPEKGHAVLLEALSDLTGQWPSLQCLIAGEGPERPRLEKMVKELGLESIVKFLGLVEGTRDFLQKVSIFVQPSLSEGLGISILEAMAMAKPVIATNSGGPTEVIANEVDGLLVEAGNPRAISQALKRLLGNQQLVKELGLRAREEVVKRFDVRVMVHKYEQLYLNLLGRGSRECVEQQIASSDAAVELVPCKEGTGAVLSEEEQSTEFQKDTLRIGVVLDSFTQPQWIRKVIGDIADSKITEVVLVVHTEQPRYKSYLATLRAKQLTFVYRLYRTLERFFYKPSPDALGRVRVEDLFEFAPVLAARPETRESRTHFSAHDENAIKAYNLDVVLWLSSVPPSDQLLSLSRYGVWFYDFLRDGLIGSVGVGFWEVFDAIPFTAVFLKRMSSRLDGVQTIYSSYSPTHLPTDRSAFEANGNRLCWLSANFVPRALSRLFHGGPEALCSENSDPSLDLHVVHRRELPTNAKMIRAALKLGVRHLKSYVKSKTGFEQWMLAYHLDDSTGLSTRVGGVQKILPPKDRFWADPFPVKVGDTYFVFLEEYLYETNKGHISVMVIDRDGGWSPPIKVLERAYHLSYPFIFEWQGHYYMVPETAANSSVEMYKCLSFPYEWRLEKTLIPNIKAADPTLVEADGRWWLFVATCPNDSLNDDNYMELNVFFAPSPLGPWEPHPANPVKSDVRNSRPAGRLFVSNGHLYRPAQDCSTRYGYAIAINRIVKLRTHEFAERTVSRILPDWTQGITCCHTVNQAGNLTVLDGSRTIERI